MEIFFIILVWGGGVWGTPDGAGFFKTLFWPFWLGKSLAHLAFERPRPKDTGGAE